MTAAVRATATPRGMRTGITALMIATGISTVGTRISFIALPWLVLVTSHDPIRMGIITGAASLPYVLNGFIASPLVDRIGARRISIHTDILSAVAMAVVAVTYRSGIVTLAIIVAVAGSLRGIGDRAKNTMLKPMMDAADVDAVRVTSAYSGISQAAQLTGGSVAGVLIALLNPWGAIWIDAASFLFCAAIIGLLVHVPTEPKPEISTPPTPSGTDGVYASAAARAKPEPYLEQLKAGFTYLQQDKLINSMVSMLFMTNLFAQIGTAVFIPVWVDSRLDHSPIALGWISSGFALGSIAGNAVFSALANRLPRYTTFVLGYLIGGPPRFLVLAFSHNLLVVVAVWAFSGFALSSANPTIGAVMYQRIPVKLLARVGALSSAIAFAGFSVGGLLGGWAVENMSFTSAVLLTTICYFAAALTPIFGYQTWRAIDQVTRSVKAGAADTKVIIKLIFSEQQWGVFAQRRDGAVMTRRHPVNPAQALHALWLMNPPELHTTISMMLLREQSAIRQRADALRTALADAETDLSQTRKPIVWPSDGDSAMVDSIVYRSGAHPAAALDPEPAADEEPAVDRPAEIEPVLIEAAGDEPPLDAGEAVIPGEPLASTHNLIELHHGHHHDRQVEHTITYEDARRTT